MDSVHELAQIVHHLAQKLLPDGPEKHQVIGRLEKFLTEPKPDQPKEDTPAKSKAHG